MLNCTLRENKKNERKMNSKHGIKLNLLFCHIEIEKSQPMTFYHENTSSNNIQQKSYFMWNGLNRSLLSFFFFSTFLICIIVIECFYFFLSFNSSNEMLYIYYHYATTTSDYVYVCVCAAITQIIINCHD